MGHITKACSRRSRLSRRLLAQAPRQPSSLLKLVLGDTKHILAAAGVEVMLMRVVAVPAVSFVAFMALFNLALVASAGEFGNWHYMLNVDDFTDEQVDETVVLGPQMFSTAMIIFRYSYKTAAVDCHMSLGGSVDDGPHKLIYRINKLPPVTIDCTTAGSMFFTYAILSTPAVKTLARDLSKVDAAGDVDLVVMIADAPSTKKRFDADEFLVALAASDSLKHVLER